MARLKRLGLEQPPRVSVKWSYWVLLTINNYILVTSWLNVWRSDLSSTWRVGSVASWMHAHWHMWTTCPWKLHDSGRAGSRKSYALQAMQAMWAKQATKLLRTQRRGSVVRGSEYNFPCSIFPVMLDVLVLLCTYVQCTVWILHLYFTCFGHLFLMDSYWTF